MGYNHFLRVSTLWCSAIAYTIIYITVTITLITAVTITTTTIFNIIYLKLIYGIELRLLLVQSLHQPYHVLHNIR